MRINFDNVKITRDGVDGYTIHTINGRMDIPGLDMEKVDRLLDSLLKKAEAQTLLAQALLQKRINEH